MNRYIEQFNKLRPHERRVVIFAALGVFIVLNWWFIWPEFGELGNSRLRMSKAEATLQKFKNEIARKPFFQAQVDKLQRNGMDVPAEDQAIHFESTYHSLAAAHKVMVISNQKPATHTNDFFIEREVGISVQAAEQDLVDFLYSLGSGDSMIRVKSVNLHPDPSRQQLNASLTIVASYQKATPVVKPGAGKAARPLAEEPDKKVSKTVTNKLPGAKAGPTSTNKTAASKVKPQ